MIDHNLADFTMKTDCRLVRVATLTSIGEELHACSTCRATLLVKSGEPAVCPVRRILAAQRARAASAPAANDASPSPASHPAEFKR